MLERKPAAAQYLDYMLAAASEYIGRSLAPELEKRGVPLECWRVLNLLATGDGWAMGELANAGLLSLPTATRVIDRMVSDALVYRAPDPEDRRRVLIFVSDKGLRVWADVKKSVDRYQKAIVHQYGDAWIRELLNKLSTLIDKQNEGYKAKTPV